ncbi:MAG: serine/threonine-protein kinase [Solirubrobacteraceae bacterium]|nr:serine/threonine-protein kinase [Solirubrobacteraceae bacterium]
MAGDVLIGRYELGDRIGSGGMSTVVRAFDARLERYVAVKVLAEHLADDTQFVQRFQREAKSAARLVHPNIVQVFDYGFDPDKGRYYIVMEYVQGRSGAQLLTEHGRLSVDGTLHLADGACRGLAHAHRHGVIHRDVKPGNLMLADDGQVKLADFGIAWAGDALQVTQHGAVLGTVSYLAPEQASGDKASPQADIYGLGVVTFQLMTGRLPFTGVSLSDLVLAQRDSRPPRLDRLVSGVPPHVADAVERALSYDPAERPGSATELRELLAGMDATAATRLGAVEDATQVTRLGDGEPTGVTRVSRRAALTGGMAAPTSAGQPTGVQRLQPRAAPEPAWPDDGYDDGHDDGYGDGRGAPARSSRGRQKAVSQPRQKGSAGSRIAKVLVVGAVMASLGGAFGVYLSDQLSSFDVTGGGGSLSSVVDDLRSALGQ